jgi:hypothetical protein
MLGSLPIASKCQPRRRNSITWLRSSAAFCRTSDSLHVLPSQLLELNSRYPMVLPNIHVSLVAPGQLSLWPLQLSNRAVQRAADRFH